jgi:cephalosporin hydroxylase
MERVRLKGIGMEISIKNINPARLIIKRLSMIEGEGTNSLDSIHQVIEKTG